MSATVTAVFSSPTHTMSKAARGQIRLLTGLGVEGDAHLGVTVKHRSRVAADPTQPNLRQVHLIHSELHTELFGKGFTVAAGQMGENITTADIDLLALGVGARLHIGDQAILEITGLRNPCLQLEGIHKGLMKAVLDTDESGQLIRKAGIMGVVVAGGEVRAGDAIRVTHPLEHRALERV
jgi:MOSC domain-containing protein YiiM